MVSKHYLLNYYPSEHMACGRAVKLNTKISNVSRKNSKQKKKNIFALQSAG